MGNPEKPVKRHYVYDFHKVSGERKIRKSNQESGRCRLLLAADRLPDQWLTNS